MFHLDNNSGVSSMPKPGAQQSAATRWFTEGSGTESPSWPGQDWFNIVQAELLNVLAAAGIAPEKAKLNQLALAIKAIANKDALLKVNLLSEIKDAGASGQKKSRENIGCGTAADKDIVTSPVDIAAGKVPVVGWMGLGSVAPRTAVAPSNSYDQIPTGLPSGFWTHVVSGGPYAYSVALQQDGGGAKNTRHLIIPADANGKIAMRWDEGSTFRYQYFYTDKNKPTAEDVGALALSGGKMAANGAITGSLSGSGAYAAQNDSGNLAPFFQLINDTATSKFFPIIKQRYTQGGGTWALGTIIASGNFQLFYLSNSDQVGKAFTFDKSGQFLPSSYSNFDARYTLAGQAYTKAESDGRFQPKGNYTPAGQAYTKAESDARYNIKNTASKAANGWWQCGSTGIIEQWCQGATMTSETTQTITFPKAFPNACFHVEVGTMNVNNSNDTEGMFQLVSKSNTGCVVRANRAYGSVGQVAALVKAVGY